MVIGLFTNLANAEIALNNLEEADFSSADISLIMKDKDAVKDISDTTGPLNGEFDEHVKETLKRLGFSLTDIESYERGVESGGAVIAISTKSISSKAASEMLQDNEGTNIRILPEEK